MGNIFIAFGEPTPLSWGIMGIVLSFAIQLVLCLKAKRRVIKCIPLYLIGCGFLYGGATSIGLFGSYSARSISGNGIVGLLIIVIIAIASIGALFAWLVYWIAIFRKRKKAEV